MDKLDRLLFLHWYLNSSNEQRHFEPIEESTRKEYNELYKELQGYLGED